MQWAITIPSLLGLAIAGTALACGLIFLIGEHEALLGTLRVLPADQRDAHHDPWRGDVALRSPARPARRADAGARTRELEHERASKMALEARLASLESRLQPHFLFNTLNAISR